MADGHSHPHNAALATAAALVAFGLTMAVMHVAGLPTQAVGSYSVGAGIVAWLTVVVLSYG